MTSLSLQHSAQIARYEAACALIRVIDSQLTALAAGRDDVRSSEMTDALRDAVRRYEAYRDR